MQNKKSKEGRESLVKREQFLNKDVNRIFKYYRKKFFEEYSRHMSYVDYRLSGVL